VEKHKLKSKLLRELRKRPLSPCEEQKGIRLISPTIDWTRFPRRHSPRGRFISGAGGAPTECESACGQTDHEIATFAEATERKYVCYSTQGIAPFVLTSVSLNLPAAASVVVMASIVTRLGSLANIYQIQRPLGTDITDQTYIQLLGSSYSSVLDCGLSWPRLDVLEACETLPAGNYTWSLVITSSSINVCGYCMKVREITCV